jgi:hypothetical protein
VCSDEVSEQRRTLTDDERYRILRRLHATLSWVGVRIPEELDLDGERVELRDLVDRFVFDDFIDDQERAEVLVLIDKLEDKAEILEEALEEEDLTLEEAEQILNRAIGVLRAIDELKHLEDEDEWEDRHREIMEKVDDANRWREFTKRVYQRDEYY